MPSIFPFAERKKESYPSGFVLHRALALARLLSAQLGLDEEIDRSIHHCLDVARFRAGTVILHHLIGLKNIGANLAAPRHIAFLAVLSIDLCALLVLLDLVKFCLQHPHREIAIASL